MATSLFDFALVYEEKEEWGKMVDCYQQVYDIESKITTSKARFTTSKAYDYTQVKKTLEALNETKQKLE